MRSSAWLLILLSTFLAGCGAARDAAVTSFRVLDAPAAFVRKKIDPPRTTTTTTVQRTQVSDVSTPGQPVAVAPASPPRTTPRRSTPSEPRPTVTRKEVKTTTPSKPASASKSTTVQFPTAKPVPGKPGYVYSVDPKGGIVDVTGYKPGDKAKDPYTQQIFIVP
ncbi:MAG: hypothetical protein ABI946_07320 [Chthoniobacterales bacterium]